MWNEEDIVESLRKNIAYTGFLHELSLKNKFKMYTFLIFPIFMVVFHTANLFISSETEDYLANTFEAISSFTQVRDFSISLYNKYVYTSIDAYISEITH